MNRIAICLSLLLSCLTIQFVMADDRPNFIIIIGDDVGWNDLGTYGHPHIKTPNVDQMAREGLRFDAAFLTCSSCSPSRCSIMTGRYPHSTGAGELHLPLPADQVVFAGLLQKAGYYTVSAGKWHLGKAAEQNFDAIVGGKPSGCENWVPMLQARPNDKPFFMWFAAHDAHRSWSKNAIEQPHTRKDIVLPPFFPDADDVRDDLALYYDEVSRLDHYTGKVLAELKAQGVDDNTLVLFMSDNGRPFPRCKTTVYDSGVQTPFVIRWPGKIKPKGMTNSLVSSADIAPTLIELAGLKSSDTFQGKSFARILKDPSNTTREFVFSEHNWHDYQAYERSVRNNQFLYIFNGLPELPGTPPADEENNADPKPEIDPNLENVVREDVKRQFLTLGSVESDTSLNRFRMLVCFDTQGASIRSLELSDPHYTSYEHRREGGYLGRLLLADIDGLDGCLINTVGAGTPASKAQSDKVKQAGLKSGDVLTSINGKSVSSTEEYANEMLTTKVGQEITIGIQRPIKPGAQEATVLEFKCLLEDHPLEMIKHEGTANTDEETGAIKLVEHPASFLTTLATVGSKSVRAGSKEIAKLESLFNRNWKPIVISDEEIHFETILTPAELKAIGVDGHLKLIKKYQLQRVPEDKLDDASYAGYHLNYTIEIQNESPDPIQVAYRQQGPTGLPLEGWWYSNKIGRGFGGAGVRDVVWESTENVYTMFTVSSIVSRTEEEDIDPETPLYGSDTQTLTKYTGVDAQYFASALIFDHQGNGDIPLSKATAEPFGPVDPVKKTKTDCSFTLDTLPIMLGGKDAENAEGNGHILSHTYKIFAGPKESELLETYELSNLEYYGWFSYVSELLLLILHFLHDYLFMSYGFAIIVLTLLVRSCMYPLSRKQAKNMQLQQALAPQLKKIREMYKDDMEKQHAEQQALFKKYKFNPVGGCGLLFFQLPIFLGLYRALAVDMKLRGAPLIPGVEWCSNLAAPDQFWYWTDYLPEILGGYNGYLGPYLNILPLVTIVLFIVQQKMFTPPATDEQQEMQQKVMMFMMVFIGVMFFRVPSGLCIYFITSSLWGIIERKLLPKPKLDFKVEEIEDKPAKERKPRPKSQKKKKK